MKTDSCAGLTHPKRLPPVLPKQKNSTFTSQSPSTPIVQHTNPIVPHYSQNRLIHPRTRFPSIYPRSPPPVLPPPDRPLPSSVSHPFPYTSINLTFFEQQWRLKNPPASSSKSSNATSASAGAAPSSTLARPPSEPAARPALPPPPPPVPKRAPKAFPLHLLLLPKTRDQGRAICLARRAASPAGKTRRSKSAS